MRTVWLFVLLQGACANPDAIQAKADLDEIASFAGQDFANVSAYFGAAESRRAARYLQKAHHWQREVVRVSAAEASGAEEEEDIVHLRAAVRLAAGSVEVLSEAAALAVEISQGPEGNDADKRLVLQCMRDACVGAQSAAAVGKQMTRLLSVTKGQTKRDVKKLLTHWQDTDQCGAALDKNHKRANPLGEGRNVIETGQSQQCAADGDCSLKQHTLWPTRVASGQLRAAHARLSDIAIRFYKQFSAKYPRARPEDINNAFFSRQLKTEAEVSAHGADVWPELYESAEYKQMRDQISAIAVEQAAKISTYRPEQINSRIVLWAAVYTSDTPHLTHVHESSVVSGSYYSQAPPGTAPIVFMDPRGGQPMHTDAIQPEGEPEAPFIHTNTFFPTTGDIVIFPSWLPHRVPPAPKSLEPRVSWAFNVEAGDFGWLSTTH